MLAKTLISISFFMLPIQLRAKDLPKKFKLESLTYQDALKASDFQGKVTILQFWASWCVGCSENMEKMLELEGDRKLKFSYVPVSVDEDMSQAQSFFDDKSPKLKKLEKKAYLDQNTYLAEKLEIEAVPALVLVDENGKVVKKFRGHLDKEELKKLRALIQKTQQG